MNILVYDIEERTFLSYSHGSQIIPTLNLMILTLFSVSTFLLMITLHLFFSANIYIFPNTLNKYLHLFFFF